MFSKVPVICADLATCEHFHLESSSLTRVGAMAFSASGLRGIHLPDGFQEVYKGSFSQCESLVHLVSLH